MDLTGAVNITSFPFNKNDIGLIRQDEFANDNYPIVYIIYNTDSMVAYVGESTNAINRMANHLSHPEKSKLKCVHIISSVTFNKSAALDIESNLIEYLSGDKRFKLLNGNGGVSKHKYYQQDQYFKMFTEIWGRLTFDNVRMMDLLELENSDVFKYSPYKSLSQDQYSSILEILSSFSTGKYTNIFVNGSAGTGKTILAIYLIKLLSSFSKYELSDLDIEDEVLLSNLEALKKVYPGNISIGFVVPMSSLRSTLKSVFQSIHGLSGSMVIGPNDVIKKEYDLLIVDESHRLTRRKSIMGYGAFDNVNRHLGLYHTEVIKGEDVQSVDKNGTQLDWILKSSKHQLFFYDSEQSIKPADIRKESFDKVKSQPNSLELHLVSQMRANGGNDYLEFVNSLLYCLVDDTTEVFNSDNYELLLFENMTEMVSLLRQRENEVGLSRCVSGYSWPWVSKDNPVPDVVIDGVELTWNKVTSDWINSTTDATEMGCIHTVQGYDLNYVGVIFSEEISYDTELKRIVVSKEKYIDKKGKQAVSDPEELHNYIIKIYKTLMFRGIKGTYIYCCNKDLREYFKKFVLTTS